MTDGTQRAAPVAVVGAGRWARQLAETVRAREPATPLVMHSPAHASALHEWIAGQPALASARVTTDYAELGAFAPSAVIVANAARDHARAIDWALEADVPVLVEKPFTDSLAKTRRLIETAAAAGRRLYAAHVLMFADYLPAFARRVAPLPPPRAIVIEWCDPRVEVRHGVSKRFDAGVPVYLDCLPHVVSILETLLPGCALELVGLDYTRGGARLLIKLLVGGTPCEIVLERHAPVRRRAIRFEGDTAASLDFSAEPGTVSILGKAESADANWATRPRPMAALIDAFLAAARGGAPDPRLDVAIALRAAELIDLVASVYNSHRLQWLGAALAGDAHDDVDVAYALAELLQAHRALSAGMLDAHAERVQRQFRSSGDIGWLAALAAAADPVAMLDMTAA